eukprot:TRINITY_DN2585_c0_g1_i5.p1 TRINITY_DN2585_c0_g1~~TRINITY_DN2585_c0_g1_i5.p1  ORF type:complete len:1775 (+),score=233.22 TRINITY_DN2585_c0_g1_i5:396-5720(+)
MHRSPGEGRHALECGWASLNWLLVHHDKEPISFRYLQDFQQSSAERELARTGQLSGEAVDKDGNFSFAAINDAFTDRMGKNMTLKRLTELPHYDWPQALLIGTGSHWFVARKLSRSGFTIYDTDRQPLRYASLKDLWHKEIVGNTAFAAKPTTSFTQEAEPTQRGGGERTGKLGCHKYSVQTDNREAKADRNWAEIKRNLLLQANDVEENPGPNRLNKLSLGSINVTSLENKEDIFTSLGFDVVALQETRLDRSQQQQMSTKLRARGWDIVFGEPCTRMTNGLRSRLTSGGVAVLARRGTPMRRFQHPELDATGRFVHAGLAYGKGKTLHVFSFYGQVGNAEQTEVLIEKMLAEAAALGNVPVVIAGDFNLDTTDSPSLQIMMAQGKWIDIAVTTNNTEPTCDAGNGLNRIDAILLNHVAATAVDNQTKFTACENDCIATHKVLGLKDLCLERYNEKAPRMIVPKQFEDMTDTGGADEPSRVQWRAERWNAVKESRDPDKMLEVLGEIVEEYCLRKSEIPETERKKYVGRGVRREPKMRTNAARQDARGATSKPTLTRLRKIGILQKVLRIVRRHEGPGAMTHEATKLWRRLLKLDQSVGTSIPPAEEIAIRLCNERREQAIAVKETRKSRLKKWRRDVIDNWNDDPAKVFQWVKNAKHNRTVLMQKANGEWTANCAEIDCEMQTAWDPILRKYKNRPEPDWKRFLDRYEKYITRHTMSCEDITGEDVAEALGRTSSRKAAGVDGFRVAELKAMPKDVFPMVASLFNEIERTGWPEAVLIALVSTIPKGAGTKPLEQRPITVTSALYRLWGSIRMRKDVMTWQEKWAHNGQHGYRKARSATDLSWKLALDVEQAALTGEEIAGVTTDFKKCFDLIPHDILLKLVEKMGLDERILKPTKDVYSKLSRRFKYPNGVGETFETTNGILQGCPLSVVYFNALSSILSRVIEEEAKINPGSYADDLTLFGIRVKLQDGVDAVTEFCDLTGQELAPSKCKWFSNRERNEDNIQMMETTLSFDSSVDIVGCHIDMHGVTELEGRINQEIEERAKRIQSLPHHHKVKEQIAAASVMPKALYGTSIYNPKPESTKKLRKAMADAIFKKIRQRTKMSHAMGLTLLSKGHCVDPVSYIIYNRLNTLVRMVRKFANEVEQVWELLRGDEDTTARGPVGLAMNTLKDIGWRWTSFDKITMPTKEVKITDTNFDLGSWQHDVREACRDRAWKNAVSGNSRRPNLRGIEGGIDRGETLRIVEDTSVDPYIRGIVRASILDNVYSGKDCPHCSEVLNTPTTETLHHINWECEAYTDIRQEYPRVMEQDKNNWPNCLKLLGIKPCNIELPEGLTGMLQLMVARIRLRRSNKQDKLQERHLERVEYAGNRTPDVFTKYAIDIDNYMPIQAEWKVRLGHAMYLAVINWMRELKWSRHPDGTGVTFLELAVDFEAFSGLNLPTSIIKMHRQGTQETTAAKKADTIQHLMSKINELQQKVKGTKINSFPITRVQQLHALSPLGAPPLMGVSTRPEFTMKDETVCIIQKLTDGANAHKKENERYAFDTEIEHVPERQHRREKWLTAAKKFPSKENDTVLRRQLQDKGPETAPPNVTKKSTLASGSGTVNSTCCIHRKKKCATCTKDNGISIYNCCFNHHTEDGTDGLIPVWDYCKEHRLTACAQCLTKSRGAEACCNNNHHACQSHDLPPCEDCKKADSPTQRTALSCCNKRHHGPPAKKKLRKKGQPTEEDKRTSGNLLKMGFTQAVKEKRAVSRTSTNPRSGHPTREPQEKGLT